MTDNPFAAPSAPPSQEPRRRRATSRSIILATVLGLGLLAIVSIVALDVRSGVIECRERGPVVAREVERVLLQQVTRPTATSADICDSTPGVAVRVEAADARDAVEARLISHGCSVRPGTNESTCTMRLPSGHHLSVDLTGNTAQTTLIGTVDLA